MHEARLRHRTDIDGWRSRARWCLAQRLPPDAVVWRIGVDPPELFATITVRECVTAPPLVVPRRFLELAENVIRHRHSRRFDLLYRLLWRLGEGERGLLDDPIDAEARRAARMADAVARDGHRMQAFLRFHRVENEAGDYLLAWFEPRHFILDRVAALFARRLAATRWSILTPDGGAHWDGARLSFGPGTDRSGAITEDVFAELWCRYYAHAFNPERLNRTALMARMAVRYWRDLPEGRMIDGLVARARAGHRERG